MIILAISKSRESGTRDVFSEARACTDNVNYDGCFSGIIKFDADGFSQRKANDLSRAETAGSPKDAAVCFDKCAAGLQVKCATAEKSIPTSQF